MIEQPQIEELYNLEVFFCKVQPEMLIERSGINSDIVSYNNISMQDYLSCFDALQFNLTRDEISERYKHVMDIITGNTGVFGLLRDSGETMLRLVAGVPTCRIEDVICWSQVGQAVGQDQIVMAWLASRDVKDGKNRVQNNPFMWPAILRSDDVCLNKIIDKGLYENHFHLNGSTQNFALTWCVLMNHPSIINSLLNDKVINEIRLERRVPIHGFMNLDQNKLLLHASMIRALLFSYIIGKYQSEEVIKCWKSFAILSTANKVSSLVESLRWTYGEVFRQNTNEWKCLDYAVSRHLYKPDLKNGIRLLGGERAFLYSCFFQSFDGQFGEELNDLLYLYLLIKVQFRRLFIQVNKMKGFGNFSDYQDRKDIIYDRMKEYKSEALRMAIIAPITDNHVEGLEARIMTKYSASVIRDNIVNKDLDIKRHAKYDFKERDFSNNYFYVLHFPKHKIIASSKGNNDIRVRNNSTRKHAELAARSIVFLSDRDYSTFSRIKGIDACSHEIGCRPETFSTEYRYLRAKTTLGFTYHVGEDYLGLCDGLRAIDEAIRFLELQRGDRIGHALALGIDPNNYYKQKRYVIYMPAQDLLDNCIWLLERSVELGVSISADNREKMKNKAYDMLSAILNDNKNISLRDYYDSWKLRGDHPSLYITGEYVSEKRNYISYNRYKEAVENGLDRIRRNYTVTNLYFQYHYNTDAIRKGSAVQCVKVEKWLIDAMSEMQQAMIRHVSRLGISIECNPTSNKLIGPFDKYSEHPMMRFNSSGLNNACTGNDLMVTINTDDLGIFDTSLENEYAVMLRGIMEWMDSHGYEEKNRAYDYLDSVRQMGEKIRFC